ncbi:carbonic anhydrase [Pyrenophora seminiperda CCB06]|uniref:Carbonic anhydrase n=1 Tax=Pyrenophora seminiperda CCB06 TaxID=1302712 RepID=A0A3M7MJP0_9PLEO|nr:carbonic anhydrase [Pyrenophora seminiperda CCB06]
MGAALGDEVLGGALDIWLGPVRGLRKGMLPSGCVLMLDSYRLRREHETELDALPDDDARAGRLAELNVRRSVYVLKEHPAVKKAIAERGLMLHGLIYDIGVGQLRVIDEDGGKMKNGLNQQLQRRQD